jgi:hypothetical protein
MRIADMTEPAETFRVSCARATAALVGSSSTAKVRFEGVRSVLGSPFGGAQMGQAGSWSRDFGPET